ncbi:putative response regulatory protein [Paenibacillus auburnensis]|uniref:Response regulatory protein n=1 Tax=Paenibacillus auburnensis TaxID=2905649 RepID=A0ABN8GCT9_9BACL|nr:response regulator [Paenibacillus auburnensis]CAH1205740.1 putative response regulatory protein [Paenibacillus auburnensis]
MIRVMIADDEEVIRRGLEKITSRMDLEVEVIGSHGNGLEAWNQLSALTEEDIDLLITDIKMPRMDGFKLIEEARGHMKNLPIAVLSGFSDFDYARRAMRFGALDYLLKPIEKSQLYELLKRVEENKKLKAAEPQQEAVQASEGGEHYVVEQTKSILEKEYNHNFELERLAETVGMNASYISRLFKYKTGQTITEYLIGIRIAKAKELLTGRPDLKNYEIAEMVGYSDPVYFNKLFKKICGMTPKDYKSGCRVPKS